MVIFQSAKSQAIISFHKIYIPVWLYFNNKLRSHLFAPFVIYIPVWLYFNIDIREKVKNIGLDLHSSMVIFQCEELADDVRILKNLHSSMVIFQCRGQSVTRTLLSNLHSSMVIFQS